MLFVECMSEDALLGFPYDPEEHGYIVIVEPGDTVADIEQQSGIPILTDMVTGKSYGDPDYSHSFDICETHWRKNGTTFAELCTITTDSGFGIMFIVPHIGGIDSRLLAFCAEYAKPSLSSTD